MCTELSDRDWVDLELGYWRQRLVLLLERRSTVEAFVKLTSHAEPAPFVFDVQTRCMRKVGS